MYKKSSMVKGDSSICFGLWPKTRYEESTLLDLNKILEIIENDENLKLGGPDIGPPIFRNDNNEIIEIWCSDRNNNKFSVENDGCFFSHISYADGKDFTYSDLIEAWNKTTEVMKKFNLQNVDYKEIIRIYFNTENPEAFYKSKKDAIKSFAEKQFPNFSIEIDPFDKHEDYLFLCIRSERGKIKLNEISSYSDNIL